MGQLLLHTLTICISRFESVSTVFHKKCITWHIRCDKTLLQLSESIRVDNLQNQLLALEGLSCSSVIHGLLQARLLNNTNVLQNGNVPCRLLFQRVSAVITGQDDFPRSDLS